MEGSKFGRLTILRELEPVRDNSGSLRRIVEVRCDCGNISEKKLKYLKSGETSTCGSCIKQVVATSAKGNPIIRVDPFADELEMIGQKYERWTVLEAGFKQNSSRMMKAACECGAEQMVCKSALKLGHSVSCGCHSRESTSEARRTHGLSNERPYRIWSNMIQRCDNPKSDYFNNYGGRGIAYQQSWSVFEGFWKDMSEGYREGLELDRVDVNGGYTKENCRWVDRCLQMYNRRTFKNNTSGKTGVNLNKRSGNWVVNISVNTKKIYLGTYSDYDLAVFVREEAELKYYGYIKE